MKKSPNGLFLLVMATCLAVSPAARSQGNTAGFSSADVTAATEISYPVNTTATGMVSLMVSLDGGANVQNVQVTRDTPPLTSAAQAAVQNWSFKASSLNGNSVAANLPVSVVFNPCNPGATQTTGLSVPPPQTVPAAGAQYTPPQITQATFALYPANSVAVGTVVLSVKLDQSGNVAKVKVVRGVATLTSVAVSAVKSWQYSAATLNGQPAAGKIVVAFVFQRNSN